MSNKSQKPSLVYEVEFDGEVSTIEHLSAVDVAVRERVGKRRFQEDSLLTEIRRRGLKGLYIDGGANVGNHTIFFSKHTPAEFVVAIEGHPRIYEVLRRNIERNSLSLVKTYNVALWKENKQAWMSKVVPGNSGRTQLCGDERSRTRDVQVSAVTLDSLFPRIQGVTVLKLDVEDCEVQAVQGAKHLIEDNRPLLIAEHHDKGYFDRFQAEVEPFGYKPFALRFDPRGETVVWEPSS